MSDFTTSTYMSMQIPIVSTTIGPTWASYIVTLLNDVLDTHTHEGGKGVKVPVGGLSIQADLDCNAGGSTTGNNVTGLRSLRMVRQSSGLTGPSDSGCLSNVNGNLVWDYSGSGGAPVQITSGGSLNSAALLTNTWARTTVSTNISIGASDPYAYYDVSTSGGARQITLPKASSVPAKFYTFRVDSAANALTFAIDAADTIDGGAGGASLTMPKAAKGVWRLWSDGQTSGKWYVERSSQELNGASVPVASGAVVGNSLYLSAAGVLTYDAINLAGGANYVKNRLPSGNMTQATTGIEGIVQLATDLGGTSTAPVVVQLTGPSGGGAVTIPVLSTQLLWSATLHSGFGAGEVLLGQATTADAAGAKLRIHAQNSSVGAGGELRLESGSDGSATEATGGDILLMRGAKTALKITGTTSKITVSSPTKTVAGTGTGLTLQAQAGVTSGAGGSIAVNAGVATTSGAGGAASLLAGNGADTGAGGAASVTAGDGGVTSASGGAATMTAGNATGGNAPGGAITLTTGNGKGLASGGGLAGAFKVVVGATDYDGLTRTGCYIADLKGGSGGPTPQLVAAFFKAPTTTDMPSGNGAIYLGAATTAPSGDPASGDTLLYSSTSGFGIRTAATRALDITGASITSATAGGVVTYLRVVINGIGRKIAILAD